MSLQRERLISDAAIRSSWRYSRLLLPLYGSPPPLLALDHAADVARLNDATVVLLHVIEPTRHSTGLERPEVPSVPA